MRRRSPASGMAAGAIFVAIGVLLLLSNLGLFRIRDIWELWPAALILAGGVKMFSCTGVTGRMWGGILAGAGVLLLLDNFGFINLNPNLIGPLVLIAIGLMFLVRAMERQHMLPGRSADSVSDVSEIAVFGGSKKRITSQTFQGGDLLAMFGGVELDLTPADIQGEQAVIDADAMFGGIEIRVPATWQVIVKGIGIFGGYVDSTNTPPIDRANPPKRLVVKGNAIFGGVEVRN
jgi:predicted membrane protein